MAVLATTQGTPCEISPDPLRPRRPGCPDPDIRPGSALALPGSAIVTRAGGHWPHLADTPAAFRCGCTPIGAFGPAAAHAAFDSTSGVTRIGKLGWPQLAGGASNRSIAAMMGSISAMRNASRKGAILVHRRSWARHFQVQRHPPFVSIDDIELRLGQDFLHRFQI